MGEIKGTQQSRGFNAPAFALHSGMDELNSLVQQIREQLERFEVVVTDYADDPEVLEALNEVLTTTLSVLSGTVIDLEESL